MSDHRCGLATILERPGCSICICRHGIVHVTIGSVTVRVSADSLEPLAAMLTAGVAEIQRADYAMRDARSH